MEPLGQADVCDEILPPVGGARPAGVLRDHLTPQLLGNAQALQRPEASDALSPVRVLGLTHRAPVAGHELADAAGNHGFIVA